LGLDILFLASKICLTRLGFYVTDDDDARRGRHDGGGVG